MKKAIIVTAFFNYDYNIRIRYLEEFLNKKGFDVKIVTSNFDHRNKKEFIYKKDNLKILKVPFYKKNISLRRIISHFVFSKKVKDEFMADCPDFIYIITPPNFLFYFGGYYKRKKTDVKLIFEIEDIWPETMPLSFKLKKYLRGPFDIWRKIRDNNINLADGNVFECNLFKKYLLSRVTLTKTCEVLYLTKENTYFLKDSTVEYNPEGVINFLYIGSINNLIDIKFVVNILCYVNTKRKTMFHIIGAGEKSDKLQQMCKNRNIPYTMHGIVYNEQKKEGIISKCHFAFNIMKDTVFVGATMKSLEYFHYGVPVINNIKGDTADIIDKFECGININGFQYEQQMERLLLLKEESYINMRKNSRKVYEQLFCPESFEKRFAMFYKKLYG